MCNNTKYNIHPETKTLRNILTKLISREEIEEIVETGTYDGLGSSEVFAKTGLPLKTIECNYVHYLTAKQNLYEYSNAEVINAFSLKKCDMINNILSDDFLIDNEYHENNNILRDNKDHVSFYQWELNNNSDNTKLEDILLNIVNNNKKQLIFLDSSGGTGFLEFKEILKIEKEFKVNKYILLDDVFHVKHYRSQQFLIENNISFEIFDNRMILFKL
jgi:hypothetical protein